MLQCGRCWEGFFHIAGGVRRGVEAGVEGREMREESQRVTGGSQMVSRVRYEEVGVSTGPAKSLHDK